VATHALIGVNLLAPLGQWPLARGKLRLELSIYGLARTRP